MPNNQVAISDDSDHQEEQHEQSGGLGCGILGRFPTISVLIFAGAGIAVGFGLSQWEPASADDAKTKSVLIKWTGLIGDLFIRALKCIVLPLVFINVILAVVDMLNMGKAITVGWKTMGLYLLTTGIAAVEGLISVLMFKGLFIVKEKAEKAPGKFELVCNKASSVITELVDGTLKCMDKELIPSNETDSGSFGLNDLSGTFVKKVSGKRDDISLSDTIYDGVFTKIVSKNIFADFVNSNFASVVIFAIVFGIAIHRVTHKPKQRGRDSVIMTFFRELDGVFLQLINWVIAITPFAVFSLIVKAIGGQKNLGQAFENVGYLVLATAFAMAVHIVVVHFVLFFILTRSNPFKYFKHIIPAMTMAFACASSAATIPVTMKSVKSSGQVPDAITRMVVPLGATINMDGGAIYFPAAVIFLGITSGLGDQITAATYFLLIIISTVGSAGTAPVPSASLVLIITAFNTVFNTEGTPEGFALILAVDWFVDRLRTVVNVTGDASVSRMVAAISKFGVLDEDELHEVEDTIDDELKHQL